MKYPTISKLNLDIDEEKRKKNHSDLTLSMSVIACNDSYDVSKAFL